MNLYCCRLVEEGWDTEYTQEKSFILAQDPEEARKLICKKWHIRKNKKGLRIEEAQIERATKVYRLETELKTDKVWNSFLQMNEEQSYWDTKPVLTCSACGGRTFGDHVLCQHCGALFN
jgi:hypothetical protein